jgi:type I restriction enzyme S subunit
LNKVAKPDFDGLASAEFIVFPDQPHLRSGFLKHRLISSDFVSFASRLNAGDRPRVDFEQIGDFVVVLPPPKEQQRIVEKLEELLSDLDAGVSALERARANLKRYRAAVLKAAVEGRLTEKWRAAHPDVEPAEKLLERILAERRRKWEEAQLRKFAEKKQVPPKGWKDKYSEPVKPDVAALPKLPEGWCWATVDQLLHAIEAGKSYKCQERPPGPGEIGVVKVSAVTWGEFDDRESKTPYSGERIDEDLLIREGDFLFSRANTVDLVGACVIARRIERQVMLSDKILRFRISEIENSWLLYVLRSRWGRGEIEAASSGNQESMRNVAQEKLRTIRIPLPPPDEQREIVRLAEAWLSSSEHSEREFETARTRAQRLRQSILKRAFEGKLVPQDPEDEPASDLVKRIRDERKSAGETPSPKRRKRTNGR